jgi:hypothetical protein
MPVVDAELATFLEGPSAQNVAIADVDGEVTVGRAWGLRVDQGRFVRAIVGADAATVANLQTASRIALMVIDLVTYGSMQLKGTVSAVEAPTAADQVVHDVYVQEFRAALDAAGRTTPLDGALPASVVVVTIHVDSVFNQTPGPNAGRALVGTS